MFKVNKKTPEQHQWRRSVVFSVNFEHILHLFSSASIVEFEQVNVSWDANEKKSVESTTDVR